MNIFQQYGIKEVADVCLYAIELDENDDEVYIPVLYLDTLKVSTVEQTAESTSANGGTGNPKLITWDYGKDITVTLEDALFTPASQGMMWGGKMGAKTLKLCLRNFYDKGTDPEEISENMDALNKALRGAVITVENFSDFCIIPDREPSYELKKNMKNQHTSGYVGGTSIYCWLVDANIVSTDGQKRVRVNDLILFYREQTQKWYFFNGRGPLFNYKDMFDKTDKEHWAIGYQYGKETFKWIKENIAELRFAKYTIPTLKIVGYKSPIYRIKSNDGSFESEKGTFTGRNYIFGEDSIPFDIASAKHYREHYDDPIIAQSNVMAHIYEFLHCIGAGSIDKEGLFRQGVIISGGPMGTNPAIAISPTIDPDSTEARYYYCSHQTVTFTNDSGVEETDTYNIYIPISSPGQNNIVEFVTNNLIFEESGEVLVEELAPLAEYEDVAKRTYDNWNTNPPCAKYDRGPEYEYADGELNFLTQQLFIDGFRLDKCARNRTYGEMTEEELREADEFYQPYRYKTSIDVEYNTNIAPPQEAIYQVDHDIKNVFYLDRIEKCRATSRFCIDTDVNLKHGQYRYLQQYAQTELTVFIDPKTMQPYEPNTFEYYRKNGQRITGNLRAFKQYETYYKWTRTKAYERQSLGNQIIIDATHFPGTYRLVGETMARSRKTGKDQRYQFEIPLCKLSADTNLTLQADGEPTTFTMTLTALRRYDGVMMKLTMYDVEEKKYGNNVSGSTQIIPQTAEPDIDQKIGVDDSEQAWWRKEAVIEANTKLNLEVNNERDIAFNLLNMDNENKKDQLDGLYKGTENDTDDSCVKAKITGTIKTVTTIQREDSTEEEPIKTLPQEKEIEINEQYLNPNDFQATLLL